MGWPSYSISHLGQVWILAGTPIPSYIVLFKTLSSTAGTLACPSRCLEAPSLSQVLLSLILKGSSIQLGLNLADAIPCETRLQFQVVLSRALSLCLENRKSKLPLQSPKGFAFLFLIQRRNLRRRLRSFSKALVQLQLIYVFRRGHTYTHTSHPEVPLTLGASPETQSACVFAYLLGYLRNTTPLLCPSDSSSSVYMCTQRGPVKGLSPEWLQACQGTSHPPQKPHLWEPR